MSITQFLADVWGPVLLLVGVAMIVNKQQLAKVYKNLENEPLAGFTFGVFAFAIGVIQVLVHSTWNTLPEIIISILGWGTMLKGAVFVVATKWATHSARSWTKLKLMPIAALVCLLIGAYLSWFGFFS